jgi:hypothetical protein
VSAHNRDLPAAKSLVKPTSISAYFDKLAVWFRRPLDLKSIKFIERESRKPPRIESYTSQFDVDRRPFEQRIELFTPTPIALQWLETRDDCYLTYSELALDLVFASPVLRDMALDQASQYMCRRCHGAKQFLWVEGDGDLEWIGNGTRYDGYRGAPMLYAMYREPYCRVTGEPHVLHIELRATGSVTLRRRGIYGVNSLLDFPHHKFWQRNLILQQLDRAKLAVQISNQRKGRRGRSSELIDRRTVHAIASSYATIQQVVKHFRGSTIRIERALRRINVSAWLPVESDSYSLSHKGNASPTRSPTPLKP